MPNLLALMVLPNCTLFPRAFLPLYVFEPRYRRMLELALEGERRFGIGVPVPGRSWSGDPAGAEVFPVTVTGLIRACVKNPDGTSNLILQGVERVRITGWQTGEPYRVAETVPFATREEAGPAAVAGAAELVAAVRRTLDHGPAGLNEEFLTYLGSVRNDPATLVDLVGAQLIGDLRARLAILGSPSVAERIEIALAAL